MDIKETKQKPCNQLIEQLRSQGLYLTEQKIIKLPVCMSPPPSIVTRLMSLVSNQQRIYDVNSPKKIWPLQENIVMVSQCNTLSIYTLHKTENQCIFVKQKQKFHLEQIIKEIVFSPYENSTDQQCFYFIIFYEMSNILSLFQVKCKGDRQISLKNQIKARPDLLAIQFISRNQFLIVTNKYLIYQYKIQKQKIVFVKQIGKFTDLQQADMIFVRILSKPSQQQDSLIVIFYALIDSQSGRCKLNVKQMVRELQGNIFIKQQVYNLFSFLFDKNIEKSPKKQEKKTNTIEGITFNRQSINQIEIIKQRGYFLLKLNHQMFIVTKHFSQYVRLDAITQNFSSFKSLVISHYVPLICCIGSDNIELWHITLINKKANCTLIDVINFNQKTQIKSNSFLRFWVMNYHSKAQTVFAFDKHGREIGFFGVKKIDKVSKIVNKIVNTTQKKQITKVQQLGKKLGVDRKSLYLKLWHQNIQNPANIYQYLLQTFDLPSIHSQLERFMRRKFISTGELIKIHMQIQKILLQKLKEQLDYKYLKWYLKTNFQKRKLKLYHFDTQITFRQFQDIYNSSIYELIFRNMNKKLGLQPITQKTPWNDKPVKDPDISIDHILQQFKLLILQNYEQFLFKILDHYRYNMIDVFQKFPHFLPRHPFKMDIFAGESLLKAQSIVSNIILPRASQLRQEATVRNQQKPLSVKLSSRKIQDQNKGIQNSDGMNLSYQKIWFNQVTEQEWSHEMSSVDYIFNILYPHYQTHQIMGLITQLTQGEWNIKNKFCTHALINTTLNLFRQKLVKIQGIKLYLSVCEFANKIRFDAEERLNGEQVTKDVLQYMCELCPDLSNIKITQKQEIFETSRKNLYLNLKSQSPKILAVMKDKQMIFGQGYQTCLLYSKMHQLMVSKEILKRQTTIFQLMTSSHSSLIAAFFIGERQRNAELFNDFMPIYSNKQLFYDSLNEYIKSNNCSRVQLEILVNQLRNRKSELRQQNNILAELLVYGFCLRTQIRQKPESHTIIEMFKQIELKLDLVLKLQKFIAIKDQLSHIFQFFYCDKLVFEEVINQPKKVIRLMMENYFNGNLNFESLPDPQSVQIIIEDKPISIDIIENTFSIMLYLKQKLYIELQQMDLCLIYGQVMVEWQQFDLLKQIFYEQNLSHNFSPIQYFEKLIVLVLNDIYTKENIYMNEQTIKYIENIIDLLEGQTNNPLIVRQKTKLQLSKVLEKWCFRIQSITLQLICIKWKEESKEELIIEIMDKCIQYFDLQGLQNLYRLLETTRTGQKVKQVRNPQSIKLAYQLANRLAQFQGQDKDDQISKIIYFVNKGLNTYTVQIGLMAETFVRIVIKKYGQDPFVLEEELRSQMAQYKKQDRIKEEVFPKKNNYLAVRKNQKDNYNKSYQIKQNLSFNLGTRSRQKSQHKELKKDLNSSQNMSKRSLKSKVQNFRDPVQGIKFDDEGIPQRIFNCWRRQQGKQRFPSTCLYLTQIRQWHLKGRLMIQHFVTNWQNNSEINEMFRNNFTREIWEHKISKNLVVSRQICLKFQQPDNDVLLYSQTQKLWEVSLDLNILWDINVNVSRQYIHNFMKILKHRVQQFHEDLIQKFSKILYYGYFFLLMSLKNPSSLKQMKGISYEHFSNLELINQLQRKAFQEKGTLQRINFEQIWKNLYLGIKKQMILKIQLLQPQTKIPENIQIKIFERLLSQLGKNKNQVNLHLKLLSAIQKLLQKYIKEQKPKVMNDLKNFFQSKIFQLSSTNSPLLRKKQKKQNKANDQYKITLKDLQFVKKQVLHLSRNMADDGPGMMKQMSEVFQQIKRAQKNNQSKNNDQKLKQIILKKILSKRSLNTSYQPVQAESFLLGRQQNNEKPFESSIVLENKNFNEHTFNINELKQSGFRQRTKFQGKRNSFESEGFKSERSQFESIINIKSEGKNLSNYSSDFLEDKSNFEQNLNSFNLSYARLLYPMQITKNLAIKDSKYQKKYQLSYPISEEMNSRIKDLIKLLNGYDLYSSKNSKYYLEENIKKMKHFGQQSILQIIQQLYFEQDSILITLNPKQLQTNRLRKSKGLGSQQQKYKQASMSYIFKLINQLQLSRLKIFSVIVEIVQKYQQKIIELKQMNNKKSTNQLQNIKLIQIFKNYLKKIFPLSDLIASESDNSIQEQIQIIFGRIYLTKFVTDQSLNLEEFKFIGQFFSDLFEKLSEFKSTQQEVEPNLNSQQQGLLDFNLLKQYLFCMLMWQILKYIEPNEQKKRKLEYLLENMSKSFIIQIYQPTQLLLKNNSQLQGVFSTKILTMF